MQEANTFINTLQKVRIATFSFSSNEEHERTQFFIYQMRRALEQNKLKFYKHMDSLRLSYDSYDKKL